MSKLIGAEVENTNLWSVVVWTVVRNASESCTKCVRTTLGMRSDKCRNAFVLTVLESTDAASVNWGSKWRTPTKAEMEELVNKCIWEYDYKNGVGGFTVKGPSGNTIFLPSGTEGAANVIEDTNEGRYRTSTLCWEEGWDAVYTIYFNKPDYTEIDHRDREYGMFIRPVCSK